jgi:diguanylate cyclase (GGDEF)-like protein
VHAGSGDTEGEPIAERGSFQRTLRLLGIIAFCVVSVVAFGVSWVAGLLIRPGTGQHLVYAALFAICSAPVVAIALRFVVKRVDEADAIADNRQSRLDAERHHRDLESAVADALEMADSEPEALRTIERSLAVVLPTAMSELLLADNSHSHLSRRAVSGTGDMPGCGVGSPQDCPAARRARVHRFADSTAVNACPKLADRRGGERCSAVCVPVSVMGRTVGVIHTTNSIGLPVDDATLEDLQVIANHAGNRLGMLRIMAETQLQAATDGLTGLLNRRAFENGFLQMRERSPHGRGVIAMADLDRFKNINDTYGHETGDRALRVFADTLRTSLRANDLLSRRGGEEFAIVFPDCDVAAASEVIDRVRVQLQLAIREAGLPSFTASFGVTPAFLAEDLDLLLARADGALFEAKRAGRDRIVACSNADPDDDAQRQVLMTEVRSPT